MAVSTPPSGTLSTVGASTPAGRAMTTSTAGCALATLAASCATTTAAGCTSTSATVAAIGSASARAGIVSRLTGAATPANPTANPTLGRTGGGRTPCCQMFVLGAEYLPIIQECLEVSDRHFVKDVQYDTLECSRRIAQAEWHPVVCIHPIFYDKCRLQFVLLCYGNLIVSGKPVHKGVNFMSDNLFQYTVCKWNREGILDCDCIKASEINAYPDLGGVLI